MVCFYYLTEASSNTNEEQKPLNLVFQCLDALVDRVLPSCSVTAYFDILTALGSLSRFKGIRLLYTLSYPFFFLPSFSPSV